MNATQVSYRVLCSATHGKDLVTVANLVVETSYVSALRNV